MAESKKAATETVWIYRDDEGKIRYRGYDKDGELVSEPKASFNNRMEAASVVERRHPKARVLFSKPKNIAE